MIVFIPNIYYCFTGLAPPRRYSLGDRPYLFLKTWLKWAISLNPQVKATSVMFFL